MKVGEVESTELAKIFPAKLETLYEMLKFIKDCSNTIGFTNTIISKIELASEEALVNIITHAYSQQNGTIEIECNALESSGIQIKIIDTGILFNPLKAIENFLPGNIDEENAQVGGYGIYFMVNMMDKVSYERLEDKNILTLIKYLNKQATN